MNKQHNKFNSVFSSGLVAPGSEQDKIWGARFLPLCVCRVGGIFPEGQRPSPCGRTCLIFFVFHESVCVCVCEGRFKKRRGSTGWACSTGTWCRVEIGVRQVEGTDHVALYAPAVSSMERANHQQRPLAYQCPPPPPFSPDAHTHTHKTARILN